mmetsp:Transcript_9706/g.40721  ORF Transcript_9706/g.40721 Transcript_9706/m.40721 type:complete len:366 (-) Transcript_9706:874-1971(-)
MTANDLPPSPLRLVRLRAAPGFLEEHLCEERGVARARAALGEDGDGRRELPFRAQALEPFKPTGHVALRGQQTGLDVRHRGDVDLGERAPQRRRRRARARRVFAQQQTRLARDDLHHVRAGEREPQRDQARGDVARGNAQHARLFPAHLRDVALGEERLQPEQRAGQTLGVAIQRRKVVARVAIRGVVPRRALRHETRAVRLFADAPGEPERVQRRLRLVVRGRVERVVLVPHQPVERVPARASNARALFLAAARGRHTRARRGRGRGERTRAAHRVAGRRRRSRETQHLSPEPPPLGAARSAFGTKAIADSEYLRLGESVTNRLQCEKEMTFFILYTPERSRVGSRATSIRYVRARNSDCTLYL